MSLMLECVVNVSEGRDPAAVAAIAAAGAPFVLDVHIDAAHHRSVLTLAGPAGALEEAVRAVSREVLARIDLAGHAGAHPRFGALDVVPFVDLAGPARVSPDAVAARERFGSWAGAELALTCYRYGPERSLPELRRALRSDAPPPPDWGPPSPSPRAGASAVGARPVLVAYNLWLAEPDVPAARAAAAAIRGPAVRALGLDLGGRVQVSCNLVDPYRVGPGQVHDAVVARAAVGGAELVGLIPRRVLEAEPPERWRELGIGPDRTIEARLEQAGLDGGRF